MSNLMAQAKKLNGIILSVNQEQLGGFERAYKIANAIGELKSVLTNDNMIPIMNLQGNKLGFKTDKDKNGGYPMPVVRECLIEAVLLGLQPFGNHFNIINAQTYPTKEGLGYLLNNFVGLTHSIVCGLPRADEENTVIDVHIKWKLNGNEETAIVPFLIKMDGMNLDGAVGKATRKGRAWLLSKVSGVEITDGEVDDKSIPHQTEQPKQISKLSQRILLLINDAETPEDLERVKQHVEGDEILTKEFEKKKGMLKKQ